MRRRLDIEDYVSVVLESIEAHGFSREMRLAEVTESCGSVLAETVTSDVDLPGFDNSAMDGYAVDAERSGDPSAALAVTRTVFAGEQPGVAGSGAVRIMTGAKLPQGASAVVPLEEASVIGDIVRFAKWPSPGLHVRRQGEDIRAGTTVLEAGRRITPGAVALAAAVGRGRLLVFAKPRVSVIATGTELAAAGMRAGDVTVSDVNTPLVTTLVRSRGGEVVHAARIADDAAALDRELLEARSAGAQLIIVIGGIGDGDRDVTRGLILRLDDALLATTSLRPGSPQGFGFQGGVPVLAFPGNPISALAAFVTVGAPVLRALAGDRRDAVASTFARVDRDVELRHGRHDFFLAEVGSDPVGFDDVAVPLTGRHSGAHLVSRLGRATHFGYADGATELIVRGESREFFAL
jgi:molybdopterin molybdotransferase